MSAALIDDELAVLLGYRLGYWGVYIPESSSLIGLSTGVPGWKLIASRVTDDKSDPRGFYTYVFFNQCPGLLSIGLEL